MVPCAMRSAHPLNLVVLVLAAAACILAVGRAGLADERAQARTMELASWGVYALSDLAELEDYPGLAPGEVWLDVGDYALVEQGEEIPLGLGVAFGVEYVVHALPGEAQGVEVELQATLLHPPMELNGSLVTRQDVTLYACTGEPMLYFYLLEYEEELKPGPWTFRFSMDGEVLAEKTLYLQ